MYGHNNSVGYLGIVLRTLLPYWAGGKQRTDEETESVPFSTPVAGSGRGSEYE